MTTKRNEEQNNAQALRIIQGFSVQWLAAITMLIDFEKKGGQAGADGIEQTYAFISKLTSRDLGGSSGAAGLHVNSPGKTDASIHLEFKPTKAQIVKRLHEEQLDMCHRDNPFLEVAVSFKGYSTKMHASEEARLQWWDEVLTTVVKDNLSGGLQVLWGPSSERQAIIEKAKAEEEPSLEDEDLPRPKLFIPLDRAETLTEENISIVSQETLPPNLFRRPNTPINKSINSLFRKQLLPSSFEKMQIKTGDVDKDLNDLTEEVHVRLLCNEVNFKSYLHLKTPLTTTSPQWIESEFPYYVKKTFGIRGLKVFRSVLISLDEQFAWKNGEADLKLTEVMKSAGYCKGKGEKGAYKTKDREEVIKILDLILAIQVRIPLKDKGNNTGITFPLFHTIFTIDSAKPKRLTTIKKVGISGEVEVVDYFAPHRMDRRIKPNEVWYKDSFFPKSGSPQYTFAEKRLYSLPDKNAIGILLCDGFYEEWRMNPGKAYLSFKLRTLLQRADLPLNGKNAARERKRLFEELEFLKEEGFIGEYARNPIENENPLDEVIYIYPPEQIKEINQKIADKKISFLGGAEKKETQRILNTQELSKIIEGSGLPQNQFANKVGVKKGYLSEMKNGKKNITPEFSKKVLDTFPKSLAG